MTKPIDLDEQIKLAKPFSHLDKSMVIDRQTVQTMAEVIKELVGALENCAKPGTYHMTGLCQECQMKVQDWGNYVARKTLASVRAKIKVGK